MKIPSEYVGVTFLLVFFGAKLVGGFNPSEKYARQIGSSPQGSG